MAAIARRTMSALGQGSSSTVGQGTTVICTFPLERPPMRSAERTAA